MRDDLFKEPIKSQFEFDESVVSVFDDMVSRSVPFYEVATGLVAEILGLWLRAGGRVCDLGCSTANLLIELFKIRPDLEFIGIDDSPAMIKTAKNKAAAFGADFSLIVGDILEAKLPKCDAFTLNYTLQFIRPPKRAAFVAKIYEQLNSGGLFIFSEKLIFENKKLACEMIKIYENYKQKQGYTKTQIAQKRQALENVLIPYTGAENIKMCEEAGFSEIECIFRWANFATFLAIK